MAQCALMAVAICATLHDSGPFPFRSCDLQPWADGLVVIMPEIFSESVEPGSEP